MWIVTTFGSFAFLLRLIRCSCVIYSLIVLLSVRLECHQFLGVRSSQRLESKCRSRTAPLGPYPSLHELQLDCLLWVSHRSVRYVHVAPRFLKEDSSNETVRPHTDQRVGARSHNERTNQNEVVRPADIRNSSNCRTPFWYVLGTYRLLSSSMHGRYYSD